MGKSLLLGLRGAFTLSMFPVFMLSQANWMIAVYSLIV